MISLAALKGIWSTRKLWGGALLAVVLVALIAGAWIYLDVQSRRLASLTAERDAARLDLAAARVENDQLQKGIAHAKRAVEQVNRQMAEARREADAYRRKFEEHDLAGLAVGRPGLITRRARAATERVLHDIETAINGTDQQSMPEPAADRPGDAALAPADRAGDRRQALVRFRRAGIPQPGRKSPGLSARHPAAAGRDRLLPHLPRRWC